MSDPLNKDVEVIEILLDLPNETSLEAKSLLRDFKRPEPNAVVFFNRRTKMLEIWSNEGGWLGCPADALYGDIAPWHG